MISKVGSDGVWVKTNPVGSYAGENQLAGTYIGENQLDWQSYSRRKKYIKK